MEQDLGSLLDVSPLPTERALLLLKNLARSIGQMHKAGDRWDQSESRVLVREDLSIASIATLREVKSQLSPGDIDVHRDYLCPEYLSTGNDDFRSDLWAWGNVAYEIVTGKRPFTGKTVYETMTARLDSQATEAIEINPNCNKDLSVIIARTLRRDHEERFQSIEELLEALERIPG